MCGIILAEVEVGSRVRDHELERNRGVDHGLDEEEAAEAGKGDLNLDDQEGPRHEKERKADAGGGDRKREEAKERSRTTIIIPSITTNF